jgi:ATP-grasp ribosomal peptide maturase
VGHAVTLVLTHPFDPTADYVISELNQRGEPVFRCDPGEFPQRLRVAARLDHAGLGWRGSLCLPEREVDLAEIGCAYYRRPTIFDVPTDMGEQVRRWAIAEARMGLGGVLSALPRWLNHPAAIGAAEYKPVQLAHAHACGLTVPATIVTNDPIEAAKFVADVGQTICKPFTPATVTDGDTHRSVFTTPVAVAEIDESIRLTAHLLQAWVPKQYEVRLTVIDEVFLAARIDAGSDTASVDWRADYDALTYTPLPEVPAPVRVGVMALMGQLGLRFGALDFVVTPDDQWIFLEINPNGQWAFIEDATGQPIAAAIADALTKETW